MTKVLAKMQSNQNPNTMHMEIKTLIVTLEKLLAVATNAKYAHDLRHSNFTSRYVPRKNVYIFIKDMYRYKDRHKGIHSSPKTTQSKSQSKNNKQIILQSYDTILCSNKNELTTTPCISGKISQPYKQRNPDSKKLMLNDSIYINLKKKEN